jgi:hypothetical protein
LGRKKERKIIQKYQGKSGTRFCHQVAACVVNRFCNFYFIKKYKIAKKNHQPLKLDKNKHRFGILRVSEIF